MFTTSRHIHKSFFFFLNDRPPPDISPFPHPAPFPSPPPSPLPATRSCPPLAADPLQPPCAERLRRGPRAHCCCPPLPSSSSAPSAPGRAGSRPPPSDRKSTRLNSSHGYISYAVFCLKK